MVYYKYMLERKTNESKFVPVTYSAKGMLGYTVNKVIAPDGSVLKETVNAVEQHKPKTVQTSRGPIENTTIRGLTKVAFESPEQAMVFIRTVITDIDYEDIDALATLIKKSVK